MKLINEAFKLSIKQAPRRTPATNALYRNKDYLERIEKEANAYIEEHMKKLHTRGSIEIPRGLSDEEVMKLYHSDWMNRQEDARQKERIYEDAYELLYSCLGLPLPREIGLMTDGRMNWFSY